MLLQGLKVICAIKFFTIFWSSLQVTVGTGVCRDWWPSISSKWPKPAQAQKWLSWDDLRGSEIDSDGVVRYWSKLRILFQYLTALLRGVLWVAAPSGPKNVTFQPLIFNFLNILLWIISNISSKSDPKKYLFSLVWSRCLVNASVM